MLQFYMFFGGASAVMRFKSIFRSSLPAFMAGVVMIASPVSAKKKPAPGPVITMTDSFRTTAGQAEAALKAGDLGTAGARIGALSPSNDLENYVVAGLRFELALRRNDAQAQRIALTDMFKTTSLPKADAPRLRYVAGYLSYVVGNYDDAVSQLDYAKTLGYDGIDATMLRADIALRRKKPKEARAYVQQAIAAQRATGKPVPLGWLDRGISMAYHDGDWTEVGQLYRERLQQAGSQADWRSALTNYLTAASSDQQMELDLYRLQAANGAMASERDYQNYAILADKAGFYTESKAIIEAGRKAGKLTLTQATTSALLKTVTPKATKEIASLPAQVKKAAAASTGKEAAAAGDSYFALAQFPQAVEQYRLALTKGGVDTNRTYARLGVALARSGDLAGAQTALAQASGPWANVAAFWSTWVEQQNKKAA